MRSFQNKCLNSASHDLLWTTTLQCNTFTSKYMYILLYFCFAFYFAHFYGETLTEITSQVYCRHLSAVIFILLSLGKLLWLIYSSLGIVFPPPAVGRLKKPHFPVAVLLLHNIQSNMHTEDLIKEIISDRRPCYNLVFLSFVWFSLFFLSEQSRLIAKHSYSNWRLLSGKHLCRPAAHYVKACEWKTEEQKNKVLLVRDAQRQWDQRRLLLGWRRRRVLMEWSHVTGSSVVGGS